jgi:putative flavoprotein involved in K+ transport
MSVAPVVIVGAGPAGLATAACLRHEGVAFRLLDRDGEVGGAYRHMHERITLASPTRYTVLPHAGAPTTSEYVTSLEYRRYLASYAREHELVPERATVRSVQRAGEGFVVDRIEGEPLHARAIVLATGMFDHPQRPSIAGLEEARVPVMHASAWRGPMAGVRTILVVGGATSAIEIAEECAREGVRVIVSARSGLHLARQRLFGRDLHDYVFALERLPRVLLGRFCEDRPTVPGTDLGFSRFRREGLVEVRGALARFDTRTASFVDGERRDVDAVVLATGYAWRAPYLPDEVDRARAGHPRATDCESHRWASLFVVGAPCARRVNSDLLRGIGADAPFVARTIADRLRARA